MKPQYFALLAGSLLVAALVLILAGPGQREDPGDRSDEEIPSLITVIGQGEVPARPDLVTMLFGIWTTGASAAEAEALHLASVERLQEAVAGAGGQELKISLLAATVSPITYQDFTGLTRIAGYRAESSMRVSSRRLDDVGQVAQIALSSGATSLQSTRYSLENPEPPIQAALREATENARLRASLLARAAGGKAGRIRELEVLGEEVPTGASDPGDLIFRARVRVTFER